MPGLSVPPESRGVLVYLAVRGAAAAIDFYRAAFGAEEVMRIVNGGVIGHAELLLAGQTFMLSEEMPEYGALSPAALGGTPVSLMIYVDDVDAAAARAVAAGAKLERPPKDEFYGDRAALVIDPFGHKWFLHTRIEELTPEEMKRRAAELYGPP